MKRTRLYFTDKELESLGILLTKETDLNRKMDGIFGTTNNEIRAEYEENITVVLLKIAKESASRRD